MLCARYVYLAFEWKFISRDSDMAELARHALKLRFSGGEVESNGLNLYDGSTSFWGFAQALQISVHAYVTGEIVTRAPALHGAKIFFGAPKRGSVVFDLIAIIEQHPATSGIAAVVFYDFIKFSFSKAVGLLNARPETPSLNKKLEEDEIFFDRLAETLEGSLQRAHRAIDNGVPKVTLERPRSELVTFDPSTSQWVNTREICEEVSERTGNITRFNSISRNGRAYIRELGRVVPFRPAPDFPESKLGFLTWSLHGDNTASQKDLKFRTSNVESARGDVKRLLLHDCEAR